MAEFCLDCYNKLNHTHHKRRQVVLTPYLELCEGCCEYKRTILFFWEDVWFFRAWRL